MSAKYARTVLALSVTWHCASDFAICSQEQPRSRITLRDGIRRLNAWRRVISSGSMTWHIAAISVSTHAKSVEAILTSRPDFLAPMLFISRSTVLYVEHEFTLINAHSQQSPDRFMHSTPVRQAQSARQAVQIRHGSVIVTSTTRQRSQARHLERKRAGCQLCASRHATDP